MEYLDEDDLDHESHEDPPDDAQPIPEEVVDHDG